MTITFNSVTLENTQTEPQKYIIFFNETNNILSRRIKLKKIYLEMIFFSIFRKTTVGGF